MPRAPGLAVATWSGRPSAAFVALLISVFNLAMFVAASFTYGGEYMALLVVYAGTSRSR